MDTTTCGVVMMLTPGVKSLRDSLINTICVFSMMEPTPICPACEQANVSNRSDHLYTRTCSEKCVGGSGWYPWQWPSSHTDIDPTASSIDTTKLWPPSPSPSPPLGIFQGWLGTVWWSVLRKDHWGHPGGRGPLTILCRTHNQCRNWQHPKGNHHSQEITPLVSWRMPGSPEN